MTGGTATVTLSKTGGMAVTEAQTLVDGLKYQNTSEDPLGSSRTVTLTLIQDSGGTAGGGDDTAALSIASAVTVTAVERRTEPDGDGGESDVHGERPGGDAVHRHGDRRGGGGGPGPGAGVDGVGAAKRVRRDPGGGRHERDVDRGPAGRRRRTGSPTAWR